MYSQMRIAINIHNILVTVVMYVCYTAVTDIKRYPFNVCIYIVRVHCTRQANLNPTVNPFLAVFARFKDRRFPDEFVSRLVGRARLIAGLKK